LAFVAKSIHRPIVLRSGGGGEIHLSANGYISRSLSNEKYLSIQQDPHPLVVPW